MASQAVGARIKTVEEQLQMSMNVMHIASTVSQPLQAYDRASIHPCVDIFLLPRTLDRNTSSVACNLVGVQST